MKNRSFQVSLPIGLVQVTVLDDRVIVELMGQDAGDTFTDVIPLTADAMQEIAGKLAERINQKDITVEVYPPDGTTLH